MVTGYCNKFHHQEKVRSTEQASNLCLYLPPISAAHGNKQLGLYSPDDDEGRKSDEMRAGDEAGENMGWGGIDDPDDTSDLDADLFTGQFDMLSSGQGPVKIVGKKPRGRPKGSKNRSTNDLAKYIKAHYRDPLLGLMDIAAMSPVQVCTAWGLMPKDAAKFWLACVSKALEYIHQRQPQAVIVAGINWQPIDMNLGAAPIETGKLGFGLDEVEGPLTNAMKSIGYQNAGPAVAQESVAQHA
ncbi:MAG: hypothetical protein COA69_13465 [Robiginitomaculum sp.]|nr:MAG: hypothetical protein COA69_13465 [Robiginitomaculum sp.]